MGSQKLNKQSVATQAKKGEQPIAMMPASKKAFDLMGDDKVELSTENDALKNKIGYDGKWLQESRENLLKQIDDEKRANFFMFRMKKQMEKTLNKMNYSYTYSNTNKSINIIILV